MILFLSKVLHSYDWSALCFTEVFFTVSTRRGTNYKLKLTPQGEARMNLRKIRKKIFKVLSFT